MSFLKSQIALRLRSIYLAVAVLHQHVLCVPQGRTIFTCSLEFSVDCARLKTNYCVATLTESADLHSSAVPDLNGPASSTQTCGGCHIVADVAGVVWYSEIFINTPATAEVNVVVGNGTRTTSTSTIKNQAQFTFDPSVAAAFGSPVALTSAHYDSTVTVGGAVLYAESSS